MLIPSHHRLLALTPPPLPSHLQVRWEDEQVGQDSGAGPGAEGEVGLAGAADSSGAKPVGPKYDTGSEQMQVRDGGVAGECDAGERWGCG